jgi:hypothetical protein
MPASLTDRHTFAIIPQHGGKKIGDSAWNLYVAVRQPFNRCSVLGGGKGKGKNQPCCADNRRGTSACILTATPIINAPAEA